MRIDASESGGAVFRFWLPHHQNPKHRRQLNVARTCPTTTIALGISMTPTSVLIVEDEMIIAQDLRIRLSRMGYEIMGPVASGEEALELLQGQQPDVVLMDIVLDGELDGIETTARIKELYDIPVIFVTANSDLTTVERAQATQPFSYLLKPVRVRELRMSIEMAVLHHATANRLRSTNDVLAAALELRENAPNGNARKPREPSEHVESDGRTGAAQSAVGRALASVGEEMHAPMRELANAINLLEQHARDVQVRSLLGVVRSSAEELSMSIRNAIDLLELKSEATVLETASFSPQSCVDASAARWLARASAQGVSLDSEVAPDVPPLVVGDQARFRRLIDLLVHNALQNLRAGSVFLNLESLGERDGHIGLQLSVRDNGGGTPVAQQRAMVAALESRKPQARSPGQIDSAGMAIVAHFVHLMHGSIWLANERGKGSTFRCALWFDSVSSETDTESVETSRN